MASFGQHMQAGAWARVQLVRGSSGGQHWAIDAQYSQARLSIGSAPDAGWPVQAPAVHPYHFEIFWDGQSLWISDTRGVGGVTLNGRPVSDWVQLRGQSQVAFGGALMSVEVSAPQAVAMASNPEIATRVILAPEAGAQAGSLVAQPSGAWDDSSLSGEATRIVQAPSESEEWQELDGESTRIASEGSLGIPGAGRPAPPPPPALMRPRLGGGGQAPQEPRAEARTMTAEEIQQLGGGATSGGDPGAASVVVQPGYPGVSGGYGAPQPPQAPSGFGQPGAPSPFGQPQASPAAPAIPQSGFMAPPSFDQAGEAKSQGDKGKGKQALPMRTWALLAVTVLAAVGLMMMGPSEEPAPPPQQAAVPSQLPQQGAQPGQPAPGQPAPGQPVPGQAAPGQPTPGQPVPNQAGSTTGVEVPGQAVPGSPTGVEVPGQAVPESPTGVEVPGQPVPPAAVPAQPAPPAQVAPAPTEPTPGTTPTATGPTADRAAADLVITGRFAEALPLYQQLAQQHPERPEYSQMVRILQRRIRCQGGVGPDGRRCTP